MGELGGEAFVNMVHREFDSLYDKSGTAIGAAIMRQVDKGLSESSASIKINGVETLSQNSRGQSSIDYQALQKSLADAVNPFVSRLEQLGAAQASAGKDNSSQFAGVISAIQKLNIGIDANSSVLARANEAAAALANSFSNFKASVYESPQYNVKDYSSEFAQIIREIQAVSAGVAGLQKVAQANVSAVNGVASAVASVENAVKSQQTEKNSIDNNAISQAVINGVNPLIAKLDAGSSNYQAASAGLAKDILALLQAVEALRKSADSNSNAISSLLSSGASARSTSFDSLDTSLAQLLNSVKSLAATVSAIHSINQNNLAAVSGITNAVKALEISVKSIDAGNTYDIDINQQGFVVQRQSDADSIARSTVAALRSGLGNGGV